ncbi:SUF system FeS cluster assembly, SufB [Artemisia annua]|uniref:SUF system FeS cluster assembly, SufB n=1 Tax=Artemisia annua TaxID=35608 RepID=A0A2U1P2P0_ARTAN|nr:SUF system FeS cluster assembly, SufB [Artemisia annua]
MVQLPFSENTKISKRSSSKSDFCYKTTKSKPHSHRFLKLRAIQSDTLTEGNSSNLSSIYDDPLQKFLKRDYKYKFCQMVEPIWSDNEYPKIDFQNVCYYSEPKKKPTLNSLDEVDPELIKYFDKLGILISISFDKSGVIFCLISEAIREYPDLVKKYLGKVVAPDDNFYAALNSAVFSDGSGLCAGPKSKISWTQVETGSAITWKYPSVVLEGDEYVGEFYSVALTKPVLPKGQYGSYPTKPVVPKPENKTYGKGYPKAPKVLEHPKNIAVQGLIYCKYGAKLMSSKNKK